MFWGQNDISCGTKGNQFFTSTFWGCSVDPPLNSVLLYGLGLIFTDTKIWARRAPRSGGVWGGAPPVLHPPILLLNYS